MGDIYKLDFPSGKSYVGLSTRGAVHRYKQHKQPSAKGIVADALRKYGFDNVVMTVIDNAETLPELCKLEIKYIAEHNTKVPNGYNLTDGGEGSLGIECSAETRAKKSVNAIGRTMSDKNKEMLRLLHTGKKRSPETIEKLRIASTGRIPSAETLAKRSASMTGNKWSEESKANHVSFMKGKKHSAETTAKRIASMQANKQLRMENNK